jgi:ABC-type Fe3+/spermidine/putrescine transport system ATPase subunit
MTAFQNVAFPLVNGPPRLSSSDVKKRVMSALEMVQLADRIAVMSKGKVLQRAPPRELYDTPARHVHIRLPADELKLFAR